jgi:4-hydroxy-tetrahydrodipicolinate synthase
MEIRGTVTALITPFINFEIDEEGFAENIRYQLARKVNGILPLGTTGEAPTLTQEEQDRIISIAVQNAKDKVPIWVGTGSNSTRQTIEKTKRAKDLGADIALIVTPYYNKPTQEGIFRHFEAITESVALPIVVYNIPGRCGVNIETSTMARLAELPNIIGVKEASGNINQCADVIDTVVSKFPDFKVFSGDDILTLPMMALGAVGVVSVVSNLVPAEIVALVNAAAEGEIEWARKLHYQLLPLFKNAFIETNPVPIKTAMNLASMPAGECRLPLCTMSPNNLNTLRQVLEQMHLIKVNT